MPAGLKITIKNIIIMRKPFSIEAAKNGAKVVTRDGRPVVIFKFDYIDNGKRRIAYCCTDEDGDNHAYLVNPSGVWMEAKESDHDLFLEVEQTYRPYANTDEFLNDMKKHGQMVKYKDSNQFCALLEFNSEKLHIGSHSYSYSELQDFFTWQDGTPCGVQEGGEE